MEWEREKSVEMRSTTMSMDKGSSEVDEFGSRKNDARQHMTLILRVLACSTAWSIVTTVTPALWTIGSNDLHSEYDGWYGGGDIVRFFEPVGGLLFSFWIYHSSGILGYDSRHFSFEHIITMIYVFGVSLYMQGGAFHSASNMFQHGVRIYLDDYLPIESLDTTAEYEQREYMEDFYYWIRTVWQHIISHYIYAVGAVITDVCIMVAFRNHILTFEALTNPKSELESDTTVSPLRSHDTPRASGAAKDVIDETGVSNMCWLVILNGVLYSVLLSIVAINFPSGVIVGLIYFPLFITFTLRYLFLEKVAFRNIQNWRLHLATRPVINIYLLAYIIALFVISAWIAAVGGFKKRSDVM